MTAVEDLGAGWAYETMVRGAEEKVVIVDLATHLRYVSEPMFVIAVKCALLFSVGLPIYFLCYTVFHLIRLPVVTLANFSLKAFAKQLWKIVRIPFYFIALELASFYGVFKPLEGRALFAGLENWLHDQKGRSAQIKDKEPSCSRHLMVEDDSTTVFIGFCMQPVCQSSGWQLKAPLSSQAV